MVNLVKGQGVSLKKEAPNLKRILVGLGWDPVDDGRDVDIDASIICIKSSGKKDAIVYYGHLAEYHHAIEHCGDNLTGDGDGDDEQIKICLDDIPNNIERLAVIINIYQAHSRRQHFGKVDNCFVHVADLDTGKDLVRYDIDGNFDKKTGIFVADIYRYNGEWKFKAVGEGVDVEGISDMVAQKCR